MDTDCKIKLVRLASGERFPVLLSRDGQPLFEPTVYAVTELRARNQSTSTIGSALRAIQVLHLFLGMRSINLGERLSSGQMFSLGEVDDLARLSRLPIERLRAMLSNAGADMPQRKVVSLENARSRLRSDTSVDKEVEPGVSATRIRTIASYLDWLATDLLAGRKLDQATSENLKASLLRTLPVLKARIPKCKSHGLQKQREGLAPEDSDELLRVISSRAHDNPWKGEYARHRNELVINWLYWLGLRRGELLGVRICDIDFQVGTVTIHRSADDAKDPRKNQPLTKTRARVMPLAKGLQALTHAYVMRHRRSLEGARRHDYLFCADITGKPLSLPALNKVFKELREKCLQLPKDLSPHVLRHTWNDRFSEEMDRRRIGEEPEKKQRAYLMGWSETSGTAAIYTRRHTRVKAQEASLKMQDGMTEGQKDE